MATNRCRPWAIRLLLFVALPGVLCPGTAAAQGLTGALIGTVKDAQGGVLPGAAVRVSSPALIGGPTTADHEREGTAALSGAASRVVRPRHRAAGFATYHEEDIAIGAGATIERTADPEAGRRRRIGRRRRARARGSKRADPGFGTRFGPEDLKADPDATRQHVRLDQGAHRACRRPRRRAAPAPPSPRSAPAPTRTSSSSTAPTSPARATASRAPSRASTSSRKCKSSRSGASAEFGNVQGAVINVVTRQGSERLLYDASYYGQTAGLTSQPVAAAAGAAGTATERLRARPIPRPHHEPRRSGRSRSAVVLRRLPVSARLRQPAGHRSGAAEDLRAEQDLREADVAAGPGLAAGAEPPRRVLGQPRTARRSRRRSKRPLRTHASVPAITFGHLTHTLSANTAVGRARRTFCLHAGERPEHRQSDDAEPVRHACTGVFERRAADVRRADAHPHDRQGDAQSLPARAVGRRSRSGRSARKSSAASTSRPSIIPTGVRFVDNNGAARLRPISSDPSNIGRRASSRPPRSRATPSP